jgi:hypothetical protein
MPSADKTNTMSAAQKGGTYGRMRPSMVCQALDEASKTGLLAIAGLRFPLA